MLEIESVVADWVTSPPGPVWGTRLASVDGSTLNGHQLVLLLQDQARMVARWQAELLATITEISYCPPGDANTPVERCDDAVEFAADEIRAALHLTRRAADSDLDLAWRLCERLPRVWEALHGGDIDLRRARVIVNGVTHLPEDVAHRVIDQLMAEASGLTTGQLAARLRRLCIEADPEDAQHRYEESLSERRVVVEANPEGTADLYGLALPPHRVAAIHRKINRLARSLGRLRPRPHPSVGTRRTHHHRQPRPPLPPRPPHQTPSRMEPHKNQTKRIHLDQPTRTHLHHHRPITLTRRQGREAGRGQ